MLLQSLCELWMKCEVFECSVCDELATKSNYILSSSKAAMKANDSFQINSKLAWDCQQPMMKLVHIT
jgi:hypothetical protein